MNAMPHLLFGLLNVRFISALGFSPQGNIAYAFLNVAIALILFHMQYGIEKLMNDGVVVGALTMLLIYLITGRFFYKLFQKHDETLVSTK
jgi:hypothetical protein